MSVNPAVYINIQKGDGTSNDFGYTFRSFKNANNKTTVKASVLQADGTIKDLVEGTDYTINRHRQGGTVVLNDTPASDSHIILESNVEFTQTYNFTSGQQVDGYVLTNALDEIAMKILQVKRIADLGVHINIDPSTGKAYPISIDKPVADKITAFDHTATKIIATGYSVDDLIALKNSLDAALAAAQAANALAQTNLAATNQAKLEAQAAKAGADAAKAAVDATNTQFQTDAAAVRQDIATGKTDINSIVTTGKSDLTTQISTGKTDLSSLVTQGQQAAQDANTAKVAAKASETAAKTSETTINNLYTTEIKPVSDLVKPPVVADDILIGTPSGWGKTSGHTYIEDYLKTLMGTGQLVWNDAGVLKGINRVDLGGGGGTGVDLKTVFDGQDAGKAMVADPSATDKYSFQHVPAIKTPDITSAGEAVVINSAGDGFTSTKLPDIPQPSTGTAGQAVVYNSGGTGFSSAKVPTLTPDPTNANKIVSIDSSGANYALIDPPQSEGQGDDYTAPITIASAPNKLKQLKVPVADPAATPDRSDKIARVTSDGSDWIYEALPKSDSILHVTGTTAGSTIDTSIAAPVGGLTETFENLVLHYDPVTKKVTIERGGTSMGGSSIPTPPATGKHYLQVSDGTNGRVLTWEPMKADTPSGTADDGKVWIFDASSDTWTLELPMKDTPITRSLTGETGVSGAPEVQKAAALDVSIDNCILQFADPITYVATSHNFVKATYSITGVTASIVWLYADPKDSFTVKQQTTTPTLDEKLGRVYIAEVEVTGSVIRSVKPIYNELSHKEYVLREIGDAVGTTVRGARFTVDATGLKCAKDATLFSFLARRVPLTGGGLFNSSKLFFVKDAILNCYLVKKGVVDNAATSDFLYKKYITTAGTEADLASGNTSVTVHYVYAPATFDTSTGNVTGVYMVVGNSVYDSISAAKEDVITADSAAEVPSFIARNCALIAKIFVRFDAVSTDPASFFVLNYANLSSKSTSVIHSSVLPDTTGVADGSILKAQGGQFVFDSTAKPLVADTAITDGQILSVQGGKAVGVDPASIGLNDNVGVERHFYYAICNLQTLKRAITTSTTAGAKLSGITSLDNKTDPQKITITFAQPLTHFDRCIVSVVPNSGTSTASLTPIFTTSTSDTTLTIDVSEINKWSQTGGAAVFKVTVYYIA